MINEGHKEIAQINTDKNESVSVDRNLMLSVVIPVYNKEAGIADIVERVLKVRSALADIGVSLEFIVVDDGTSDRISL